MPDWDHLTVNGQKLECYRHGPGPSEAPTLVFLHEGLGCAAMWHGFPAALAERTGCGVFVFSRLGYGGSDACDLPRPIGFMHTEGLITMPALIQAAGMRKAILIGHSDGGSIALIHAGGTPASAVMGVITEAAHVFCESLTVTAIEKARENYCHQGLKAALEKYHGPNTHGAFWGWNDTWLDPDFRHWNIEAYLPRISVPVLAIQGKQDEYGTLAQVDAIRAQAGAGAQVCILEGCGHAPHKEKPEATLDVMSRFVKRLIAPEHLLDRHHDLRTGFHNS
jgi:pimeloyl-ACP methyl ester carboxylesterase